MTEERQLSIRDRQNLSGVNPFLKGIVDTLHKKTKVPFSVIGGVSSGLDNIVTIRPKFSGNSSFGDFLDDLESLIHQLDDKGGFSLVVCGNGDLVSLEAEAMCRVNEDD